MDVILHAYVPAVLENPTKKVVCFLFDIAFRYVTQSDQYFFYFDTKISDNFNLLIQSNQCVPIQLHMLLTENEVNADIGKTRSYLYNYKLLFFAELDNHQIQFTIDLIVFFQSPLVERHILKKASPFILHSRFHPDVNLIHTIAIPVEP